MTFQGIFGQCMARNDAQFQTIFDSNSRLTSKSDSNFDSDSNQLSILILFILISARNGIIPESIEIPELKSGITDG